MKCPKCGVAVSFWRLSTSALCDACAASQQQDKELRRQEEERKAQEEHQAKERLLAAIRRGVGTTDHFARLTDDDRRELEGEGRLIVVGQLIRCPVCGHDRFSQQSALLSSRAAAFFDMQWASDSADTRICQRCGHILWFMRQA